jgi:hypothetical protein
MRRIGIKHVRMMAQIVAPTLSILCLCFECPQEEETDLDCYEVVEAFFSRCLRIRDLRLLFFYFGNHPSSLTPIIMDGLGRLKSLDLIECRGDLMIFLDHAPIQNISKIDFDSRGIDAFAASAVISAIAMKCGSLKSISLTARFNSWESIYTQDCRVLS